MSQRSFCQSDYPYFVTTKTRYNYGLFADKFYANQVARCIFHACNIKEVILYAFCIMPDHVHLLIKLQKHNLQNRAPFPRCDQNKHRTLERVRCDEVDGGKHGGYNLSNFMQSMKGTFSRQIFNGIAWQKRFNYRIVDNYKRLDNTLKYIENNPKKADLPEQFLRLPYMYFNRIKINKL